MGDTACRFCQIVGHPEACSVVFEDAISIAFLDHRPVFPGHTLVVPKAHYETLSDLPSELVGRFFENVQHIARGVEVGMQADGTFVAINNKVSQSVPHLHVHVVPRRKKDGLRGFFWPRQKYKDDAEMKAAQQAIRDAIRL